MSSASKTAGTDVEDDDSGDDERLNNTNWQDSACVTFEREDLKQVHK